MGNVSWRSILPAVGLLWAVVTKVLDIIGYVDTYFSHREAKTVTWLGKVMGVLLAPPPWIVLGVIVAGLAATWWDARRPRPYPTSQNMPVDGRLTEPELRNQATKWLAAVLADQKLHIRSAHIFGSIMHDHYDTSDVDVIVEFKNVNERRISSAVRRIKGNIARDFFNTFNHKLHVTFFCEGEEQSRNQFFLRAGDPRSIWSDQSTEKPAP